MNDDSPSPKGAEPRTGSPCYDEDGWRQKQLALNAGRGAWGGNDGSVRGVLEAWELPLEGFLRSLCDWGYEIRAREAALPEPPLDVGRLTEAFLAVFPGWIDEADGDRSEIAENADAVAAEYARLRGIGGAPTMMAEREALQWIAALRRAAIPDMRTPEGDAGVCPTCQLRECIGRLQYENCTHV